MVRPQPADPRFLLFCGPLLLFLLFLLFSKSRKTWTHSFVKFGNWERRPGVPIAPIERSDHGAGPCRSTFLISGSYFAQSGPTFREFCFFLFFSAFWMLKSAFSELQKAEEAQAKPEEADLAFKITIFKLLPKTGKPPTRVHSVPSPSCWYGRIISRIC